MGRGSFAAMVKQKDFALIKANKQLSVCAAMHGSADQEKAAKFLFDTLQKYISENDSFKIANATLESALQIKTQQIQSLQESNAIALDSMTQSKDVCILQSELREEREHFGADRITKLEQMVFDLQTSLARKSESCQILQDENRKLAESAPLNEVETIEFLSSNIYKKDEHIRKLQRIIDAQKGKISELNLIEKTLRDQTSQHQNEITQMQQKHQRVNNILGTMKIQSMQTEQEQLTNAEWTTTTTANEIDDCHIDVCL